MSGPVPSRMELPAPTEEGEAGNAQEENRAGLGHADCRAEVCFEVRIEKEIAVVGPPSEGALDEATEPPPTPA